MQAKTLVAITIASIKDLKNLEAANSMFDYHSEQSLE
jgi:hypothetical protein